MKKILLFTFCLLAVWGYASETRVSIDGDETSFLGLMESAESPEDVNANITFCVDLSCFIATDAVAIAGTFNEWNPGINFMSDPDGDKIYCTTISMPDGPQEYKFFFAQEQWEDLTPGDPCTVTNFGFTNRIINVIPGVPQTVTYGWETCESSCAAATTTDVTFCVDLSCFIATDAVAIAGSFNGWNPGVNFMSDPDGDKTFCTTIGLPAGTHEFKYFFAQEQWEDLTPGDPCTMTTGPYTNRVINVVQGVPQTVTYGWETCEATCPMEETTDITFCVDLSCFPVADAVAVAGTFNGWSPGVNFMSDPDGDDIYCVTVGITPGQHEFKYFFAQQQFENLIPGDDCTVTNGGFTNRALTVVAGVPQTVTYGWGSCTEECYTIPEPEVAAPSPDPCKNVISLFSNVYDDVPVDTWLTGWSPTGPLTDLQIQGNDTKKYENVSFLGIETVGPNLIDATAMTHFNIDIWTPNMSPFRVKLVDFGPDGVYSPWADDSEFELTFYPTAEEWNTYKIPLSDFVGLNSVEHIAQYILSGEPWGSGIVYVDNVYFSNDNPVIPVAINQANLPTWCQGVKTLRAKVPGIENLPQPVTFLWSNGATDQEILATANGTYSVVVTDGNGCTGEASTLVDEDLSSLLSAHTIIVDEEMDMISNLVISGGVGVLDADEVSIKNNSDIMTFLRSAQAYVDGTSNVADYIESDSPVFIPPFVANPNNDYNNLTITSNMTLSGSNYGDVVVYPGVTLTIANGEMYMRSLKVYKGSTIIFDQPGSLMIRRKMNIDNSDVNVGGPSVVVYVGDNATIGQGSVVEVDIFAPEGLEVSDSGASFPTFMNGLFICGELESGDNVEWNWNPTCGDASGPEEIPGFASTIETENPSTVITQKNDGLNIYPNPVANVLNIDLELDSEKSITMDVVNINGQVIFSRSILTESGKLQLNLEQLNVPSGLYILNVQVDGELFAKRFVKE
ncbi:MAG: T9SS C-terminal target domain-containing protein [Bacteroidetes bacterium]|nr:MAG: T9SS C-terminal target domain-containing protein [Bacteroidota bacterium]